MIQQSLLVALTTVLGLGIATPAIALPIQQGLYTGPGSQSIQVAAKGDRICYQGVSRNGALTATLSPHPKVADFYVVEGLKIQPDGELFVVHQPTIDTLLTGTLHNLTARPSDTASPRDLNTTMKSCLNAQGPFNKTEKLGR
jgi:hypothetical protein